MQHKVQASNNKQSINAGKGDTIEIQLDETPTAGYSWDIESINGDACSLVSSDYKLYPGAAIGGGGIRTMVFIVQKSGKAHIKLKNWQRWSGDVYQSFEIDVNAQ